MEAAEFESENHSSGNNDNSNNPAAIRIDKLTKSFGNFTVVDDFTLTVEYAKFLVCLVPKGSGKTTTIILSAVILGPLLVK
jgi:ABC-type multidrug transport system ATPase subunit